MMNNERASTIGVGIIVACAIIVTSIRILDFASARQAENPVKQGQRVGNPERYRSGGIRIGSEEAAVHIVEFADFECPACATFSLAVEKVRKQFPNEVTFTFRHFPLAQHPRAFAAALAAECAQAQGRFQQFHDFMFRQPVIAAGLEWSAIGDTVGVASAEEFKQCIAERRYLNRVTTDTLAGHELGVGATPTFLLNDRVFVGAPNPDQLAELVANEINATRRH
jgi:protein-disulfide isomerase